MKRFAFVLAFVSFAGCVSAGEINKALTMNIAPGMTREQVISALGAPGSRSFRDNAEALQYCSTGYSSDEYTTVWLLDGKVTSLTQSLGRVAFGPCGGTYLPIDWGQAPPDIRIAIEQR